MTLESPGAPTSTAMDKFSGTSPAISKRRVGGGESLEATVGTQKWPRLHRLSVVVLVVGLAVTGALTASSRLSDLHNEQRLSNLQTSLTASALAVAPVDLERRLGQVAAASGELRTSRDVPSRHRGIVGSNGTLCERITCSSSQRASAGTCTCRSQADY